jgi:protein phosphatase
MDEQTFRYDSFGVSDKGNVRPLNEDNYLIQPRSGLWMVADGMGGHDAGEVASSGIVEEIRTMGVASSAADQHARFVDRLSRANATLRAYSAARDGSTVGSTVAALLIFGGKYRCMWVGDSRVYQLRRGVLTQISKDHSEVQELVDKGVLSREEARSWPRRNVITRAVGVDDDVDVDVVFGDIEPGDTYLICSDGLTAHLSDEDIQETVAGRKAKEACEALVALTLQRGATDNVTVIVVQCRSADSTVPVESAMLTPAG